jgi:hypothetical protein
MRAALFLCVVCCGLLLTFAPLDTLLNSIPDDSFYAHNTALNLMRGHGSTFDQINRTNGYHPLWIWLEVPVFALFGCGGEGPLRAILALQAFLNGITALLLFKLFRRAADAVTSAAGVTFWALLNVLGLINGLETGLYCTMLVATMLAYLETREASAGRWRYLALGVLLGLTFLGRTDAGFLALFIVADVTWRLWRARPGDEWAKLALCHVPAAVLAGAYLAWNYVNFGAFQPVSGAAKIYYSNLALEAALKGGAKLWLIYLRSLTWPFWDNQFHAVPGLVLIPIVWPLVWWWTRRGGVGAVGRLYLAMWPLWLGFASCFVYYALLFKSDFARSGWYYIPTVIHAAMALVVLFAAIDQRVPLLREVWPAVVAICCYLVGQPLTLTRFATALAMLAGCWLVVRLISLLDLPERPLAAWAAEAAFVVMLAALVWRLKGYSEFLVAVVVAALVAFAISRLARGYQLGTAAVVVLALSVGSFPLRYMLGRHLAAEVNYNSLLYRGALWIKDNTTPDTVLTAGSAGILGYFSERRVINTDGLINSYDYLRDYLMKGRMAQYLERSDAFVDVYERIYAASKLGAFPKGIFIELPQEIRALSFNDGYSVRRLYIHVMDPAKRYKFYKLYPRGESIPNGDFELGLEHWHATGDAFTDQPTCGDNPYARGVEPALQHGSYWIGTFDRRPSPTSPSGAVRGNEATGTLESDPFPLRGRALSFLVGGGDLPGTRVDLVVDGKVVATARGARTDTLRRVEIDIRPWAGKPGIVRIVDQERGPWGVIDVDDFRLVE